MSDIWAVLGIEPTTDKRKIKKAYAEAVKTCHPEERPEEFKQLYEAYQAALNSLSADNRAPRGVSAGTLQQETLHSETSQHKALRSEVSQQEAQHPEKLRPETQHPEILHPESLHSETLHPETQHSETLRSEMQHPETLRSETLHSETLHSEPVHPEAQQEMSRSAMREDGLETSQPGMQMIFARNNQQKQRAWEQLTTLWDTYLENRNRQNASALIQFLKGTEFSRIRDLDDTMQITMLMVKYMIAENRAKADDKVLCALCDLYVIKDTASDEFDVPHLDDSVRRELSAMLRNERDRRVQMRQQKRGRVANGIFNLILFGGMAGFIITVIVQMLDNTKRAEMREQCQENVAYMLEQEYPQLHFGNLIGKWEISDGDTENTYIITTEVSTKSGVFQRGSIRVEAERDQEGNVTIISEEFIGIDVK